MSFCINTLFQKRGGAADAELLRGADGLLRFELRSVASFHFQPGDIGDLKLDLTVCAGIGHFAAAHARKAFPAILDLKTLCMETVKFSSSENSNLYQHFCFAAVIAASAIFLEKKWNKKISLPKTS